MQLLIVHDDAEVGGQLMAMVHDYTEHECALVENDETALRWAHQHARCGILLAQLEGPAVDGLTLGGSLGEVFPGLQTLFLPAYPATERRLEISKTKVFPEPIDGDRLLEAIEEAAAASSGAADFFHVMDVLQMCCLSGRSGAVQIVKQMTNGIVYVRDGKIVHAESAAARGTEALLEILGWGPVEFAYDATVLGPETISMPWDEALIQAVIERRAEESGEAAEQTLAEPTPGEFLSPSRKRGFFAALRRG